MIETERPSDARALNLESLWYDNNNDTIYCFGGATSFATSTLQSLGPPPDSIWGFRPNGEGSGAWYQVLGPVTTPFPAQIHRIEGGATASDGRSAYYLGGWGSRNISPALLPQSRWLSPGLVIFDFDTHTITNSTDDGHYITSQTPGAMVHISIYGDDGILVILPDGIESQNVGFNNITFYDKKNKTWYSQVASGEIPPLRSEFYAIGIEGDENSSYEM